MNNKNAWQQAMDGFIAVGDDVLKDPAKKSAILNRLKDHEAQLNALQQKGVSKESYQQLLQIIKGYRAAVSLLNESQEYFNTIQKSK